MVIPLRPVSAPKAAPPTAYIFFLATRCTPGHMWCSVQYRTPSSATSRLVYLHSGLPGNTFPGGLQPITLRVEHCSRGIPASADIFQSHLPEPPENAAPWDISSSPAASPTIRVDPGLTTRGVYPFVNFPIGHALQKSGLFTNLLPSNQYLYTRGSDPPMSP